MPNIYMHAKFALDIYDRLDIETKYLLIDQKSKLTTFAQSMDPLFLYDIKKIKSKSSFRDFAYYFHKNKSKVFFINLINYIKYNHLEQNPEIMAFLYGFLSHYILDSTFHPYIIFKTGYFDKNDIKTVKYLGKHHLMETYLDKRFILLREKSNPTKYKFYNLLDTSIFSNELITLINIVFKETYDVNKMSKYYYKSIINMKHLYKLLRYDPTGIKCMLYKSTNPFIKNKIPTNIKYISYSYNEKHLEHYLNLEKKTWNYPTNKRKKSNESVIDLYLRALFKCNSLIKEINNYLYKNKKVNLKKLIDNLSYTTGTDCNNKEELKYFES